MDRERQRLREASSSSIPWRKWGPYLSERQWGTVREDYSDSGDAWNSFPHDHARSRAYQWGEDGIAGICDDRQRLCFALALWNGRDPIVKERLFGLANSEGNHGEDVKECYFYLDSTPTHSYMKCLYKYPQRPFPYDELVTVNRSRSRLEPEFELSDTGIFDEHRYYDVYVEYAKAAPTDLTIKLTVCNRGPDAQDLHVLPTLWFRNTWSWRPASAKPEIRAIKSFRGATAVVATNEDGERYYLLCDGKPKLLFTENETNNRRLYRRANEGRYLKDGINNYLVAGDKRAINPTLRGTKVSPHYKVTVPAGLSVCIRLRLCEHLPKTSKQAEALFGPRFESVLRRRRGEADEFYRQITPAGAGQDEARVFRQALAGLLWSKQYYCYDVNRWLKGHAEQSPGGRPRNSDWSHLYNSDVISMPDKWEYPWYAAWDLAFQALPFGIVDMKFAQQQLLLLLSDRCQHPNGQIPAYEWNFSDVNPPVTAWASLFLYKSQIADEGRGDDDFLKRAFNKLLLNFTWWVNRKDRAGRNVFEGGFLGLDNIGVFDRSAQLPGGGYLEQADGTAWMAFYCQNMLEIAAELATIDPAYEDLVVKFAQHFVSIAAAMNREGNEPPGLWDEQDGLYYDLLRKSDGAATHLKVRSLVSLFPLCAVTVIERHQRHAVASAVERINENIARMPELRKCVHRTGEGRWGEEDRGIFSVVNEVKLRRILSVMLDESEFLGPYGIRSLSRSHAAHPYRYVEGREEYTVEYTPGDSASGMFGGNSNWRGPVWFPMNVLLIRALLQFYLYYGNSFRVECPTGSGNKMNLYNIAAFVSRRLTRLFLQDEQGRRPCHGEDSRYISDPYWRDLPLFHEYFHGDSGKGLGASHQTGWTALVAQLMKTFGTTDERTFLKYRGAGGGGRGWAAAAKPSRPRRRKSSA